ncbi:hypothetical protein RhiirA1_441923, partial [Rhizophagus irregularis]
MHLCKVKVKIKNNAGFATPIAFGMSNKENNYTIRNNWMCKEWCMQFIDAGRLPVNNEPLWTTNNYMERINQTIEATYSGKQSVLTFVERLYGVTLMRENIMEQNTGRVIYEAGLITTFNAQSIEQNYNIYQGSTEVAFLEIVKEYNEKGNVIFYNIIDQEYKVIIDPFRPSELQQINLNSLPGAPPKSAAKPRKPSKILRENNTALNLNTPSIQKRKTDQIRKAKRGNKSQKVNALNELDLNISNFSMIPFTNPPTYSTTHYPSIYNSTTHFSNTHNTYFFQLHIFLQFLIHIFLQLI